MWVRNRLAPVEIGGLGLKWQLLAAVNVSASTPHVAVSLRNYNKCPSYHEELEWLVLVITRCFGSLKTSFLSRNVRVRDGKTR